MQKKIVLCIKYLAGITGGAERNVVDLANHFADTGNKVYIVVYEKSDAPPAFGLRPEVTILNARKLHQYHNDPNPLEWVEEQGRRRAYAGDEDAIRWFDDSFEMRLRWGRVILSLEPSLLITFLPHTSTPLLEQLGERLPIIVTNQNTPAVDYFSEKHDTQAFDRYKRLKNLDLARAVHVLIPEFASFFPEHLRDRVHAIPNVVHPINEEKSLVESSKTIIALGRFDVQKRFDLLIRSMPFVLEKAPKWRLTIFGRGPEEDNLRTLIRQHSLQRSVLLMGRTAKPLDELRKADLFVIPSSYEGWGLTLTEAMSVGLPCIGFQDCSGVNWILRDGETGVLLRERSAEALADGILHLIADSVQARRYGENARAFVRQFGPEKVYAVWDSLIDGVLK